MRSTTTTLTATAKNNNNNGNLKSSNNKVKFVLLQAKKGNNNKREASPSPELQSKHDANCDFKKTKTLMTEAADTKPSATMKSTADDTNTSIVNKTAAAGPKTPKKESQGDENALSPRSVFHDDRVTTTFDNNENIIIPDLLLADPLDLVNDPLEPKPVQKQPEVHRRDHSDLELLATAKHDAASLASIICSSMRSIIQIQALMRGTLARWQYNPVCILQRKLAAIHKLKDQQLKKIEQRKAQKMRDFRIEMEHTHEHRVLMRRLHKANKVRAAFQKLVEEETKSVNAVIRERNELHQANVALARQIIAYKEDMKAKRREILALNFTTREWQPRVFQYMRAVQIFKDMMPTAVEGEET